MVVLGLSAKRQVVALFRNVDFSITKRESFGKNRDASFHAVAILRLLYRRPLSKCPAFA